MKFIVEKDDCLTPVMTENFITVMALMGSTCRIGVDGALHVARLAMESTPLEGSPVEFGCFIGETAALISRVMNKQIWLYDSFTGLPEKGATDGTSNNFEQGGFRCDYQEVLKRFVTLGLQSPVIVRGWFDDVLSDQLPEKISFAHLDGDFYDSVRRSLELVYPRLVENAVCMIHDYHNDDLPGAKKAVDDFLANKPESPIELTGMGGAAACHCFFRKKL